MRASEYEYEQQTWPEQIEFDNLYTVSTVVSVKPYVECGLM